MEYPSIIRDTIDFVSDTEVCNIGFSEGILSDSRPYRLEVWESYNIKNVTIFISIKGFEESSEEEIKNYLVKEGIIEIKEDDIYITEVEDSNEEIFLSVNMPIQDHDRELNKYLVKIKPFEFEE